MSISTLSALSSCIGSARRNACLILTQVRTATKRAAGSRTSMKDSAGRRLGPKKYEGQQVKVGEIIMRQRGTKFFPGENVGIGKDHTIYAKEPGVVRYYLDPFHPKRKFIGVSLSRELRLPLPHFEPRVRRFGRQVIKAASRAKQEDLVLPRKKNMVRDDIIAQLDTRETRRKELAKEYITILRDNLKIDIKSDEIATSYLIRLRSCVKNGMTLEESQFNAKYYLEYEARLQSKREKWEEQKSEDYLNQIKETIQLLNKSISFDNKLNLIRYISDEEKKSMKDQFIEELNERASVIQTKKQKNDTRKLFSTASDFLSFSEEVRLRRKYLKPIQPENQFTVAEKPTKSGFVLRRFNYEKSRVEIIPRRKEAFLNKL
ncbi:hypothetical protein HG535_0B04360 [Zygotorulaspora mrakii]|uniref:Large ribosomal subunit protein bL27m n=1 Tax=Zygotorulaspora mrakii TaxID=42260 RepID=A0A7H9AZ31_ZYGMR|nr:uncharacterized protein HG535_0B04360 [Zygotorulaspora mrakii]QLG71394.1 hypothetical protein HG535_0B04360 [Zygotorulaspora mrakii]